MSDLVDALLDGTRKRSIRWAKADYAGRSFIAKRESGTVVLSGGGASGLGPVRLVVQDADGSPVEHVTAQAMTILSLGPNLKALYQEVVSQSEAADATVGKLAKEFRESN